jgi:hypothetical protein
MDIEFVRSQVIKARKILEEFGTDIDPIFFRNFPNGCCGNTSDLLGQILSNQGVVGLKYVYGMRGKASHAWLELNGQIIDITSDQFEDGCGAVFFAPESEFHKSFKNQTKSEIAISPILASAYSKFLKLMKIA